MIKTQPPTLPDTLAIIERITGKPPKPNGKGWQALCPAHEDTNPSLSIREGNNGKVIMHCHAGCDYNAILQSLGYSRPSPHSHNSPQQDDSKHIVATYDYRDANGQLSFQKVRYEPKSFRIRHLNGNGSYQWGMGEAKPILYHLPEVSAADQSQYIFMLEGEKDVDRLLEGGLVATTNFDGANGKWRPEYNPYLSGRNVVIIPDNDQAGQTHAEDIAKSLYGIANQVKVLPLPDLDDKEDVSDWLDKGHSPQELYALALDAPGWQPKLIGWQIKTLKDAYRPRPPKEYIVDGIIERPSLNIFFGSPGTLKSMLLADMMCDVAIGANWLSNPHENSTGIVTKQTAVLWIDSDNGIRRTEERFEALARERNLPKDAPFCYVSMPNPPLIASDEESMRLLGNHIRHYDIGLVIIDNLGLTTGGANENDPTMARVMANYRSLVETLNVAIILIHHQRKSKGDNARMGDSLRGHSSIEASADLALLTIREPLLNQITLMPTKVRGADIQPVHAEFTYTHRPGTKDLETARFWGVTVKDTTSYPAVRQAIMQALKDGLLNQSELIMTVKDEGITLSESKIREYIIQMEQQGDLDSQKGAHNAIQYTLPRKG